ncbi:hypothetical protein JCM10207_000357 [Rhodosporidiobolus poonsookiae]
MATQAFADDYAATYAGHCCFVQLDPQFDTQVADIASVLARSLPDADRAAFTQQLVDQAKAAIPPTPEHAQTGDDDEDDEEPTRPVDTPETLAAKRQVVQSLVQQLAAAQKLDLQADREFEGLSNLALALVLSVFADQAELPQLVQQLAALYTSLPSSSAVPSNPARYTALSTLFNALPSPSPVGTPAKLATLETLVAFAAKNDDVAVLAPILSALPALLTTLELEAPQADATVLGLARALASNGAAKEARQAIDAYFASPLSKEAVAAADKSQLADLIVALSLAAPDVYDLTPLASLPAQPATTALSTVLAAVLAGDLAALSSAAVPEVAGVAQDADALARKVRLVKLAELCSTRVGEQVQYAEIAQVLELKAADEELGEEVETWVIDAIRASLLTGRLSQPTQSLSVTRALPPTLSSSSSAGLDTKHWKLIEERLEGWKVSLARVAESARKATQSQASAAGARERADKDEE